ncbi:ferritin-like domain-containing protein [Sorangium sp. So ce341]|uniref:ferritin-like domain-containing protein n=1 Tax=Sorangium sp. So ce341 TaxID=3133302 RepID=UPI003F61D13D
MLFVDKTLIARVREARNAADVVATLEGAIQLELSTLPPYLTGVFSLQPGANDQARILVQAVVVEEMLHMALAANTAVALGGNPPIRKLGLALKYPGPLPMSIDPELTVSLGSLTTAQLKSVFMAIERPDTTAVLPGEDPKIAQRVAENKAKGYGSIGDFYNAVIDSLERLVQSGQDPFGDPRLERQLDLSRWFPSSVPGDPTCRVRDLASAEAALRTIIRQGEGANVGQDPINPHAGGNEMAHYFKFGEIAFGHRLVPDKSAPSGWSYTGESVPLDASRVYRFPENARLSDYSPTSAAGYTGGAFYDAYLRLLDALDATWNGRPEMFNSALGIMFELKLVAQQVVQHLVDPANPDGPTAAPPFQP